MDTMIIKQKAVKNMKVNAQQLDTYIILKDIKIVKDNYNRYNIK